MSKNRRKDSNTADGKLFNSAMDGVRPLSSRKPHRQTPQPTPRAVQRRKSDSQALTESLRAIPDGADLETGEELIFRRPGLRDADFRKLRGGKFSMRDELDLHGMTEGEAIDALREFLAYSVAKGNRCVRIVHGKGLGSGPRGPVLKSMANRELRRWDKVLAFCSAQPRHGGTGAVYVLLKR